MLRSLVVTISVVLSVAAVVPAATASTPLPDLVPSQFRIERTSEGGACGASFQITVKNKGAADAGAYVVDVGVIRNDVELFSFPVFVDGTAARDRTTVAGSFGVEGGVFRLAFGVNQFHPIEESDNSNNSLLSRPFACPAPALR